MSRLNAANNAQSLLDGGISDTDVSMTVLDGSVFPEPPFLVTIEDEIIEVGAKSGNVFSSLLRGQEGTVAVAHADGVEVQNRMTVGMYDSLALQEDVTDLAGTGRTIETVKGNADDLAAHLAESVTDVTPPHGMGSAAAEDYEQGNWSPFLGASDGVFASVTYDNVTFGKYVKIGNVIHIRGLIKTDAVDTGTVTGYVTISGFPFTADNNWAALNVAYSERWDTNNPDGLLKMAGNAIAYLMYKSTANGNSARLPVSNIATGADSNEIHFSGTYFVP